MLERDPFLGCCRERTHKSVGASTRALLDLMTLLAGSGQLLGGRVSGVVLAF